MRLASGSAGVVLPLDPSGSRHKVHASPLLNVRTKGESATLDEGVDIISEASNVNPPDSRSVRWYHDVPDAGRCNVAGGDDCVLIRKWELTQCPNSKSIGVPSISASHVFNKFICHPRRVFCGDVDSEPHILQLVESVEEEPRHPRGVRQQDRLAPCPGHASRRRLENFFVYGAGFVRDQQHPALVLVDALEGLRVLRPRRPRLEEAPPGVRQERNARALDIQQGPDGPRELADPLVDFRYQGALKLPPRRGGSDGLLGIAEDEVVDRAPRGHGGLTRPVTGPDADEAPFGAAFPNLAKLPQRLALPEVDAVFVSSLVLDDA